MQGCHAYVSSVDSVALVSALAMVSTRCYLPQVGRLLDATVAEPESIYGYYKGGGGGWSTRLLWLFPLCSSQ
jgi:hypothetical protein